MAAAANYAFANRYAGGAGGQLISPSACKPCLRVFSCSTPAARGVKHSPTGSHVGHLLDAVSSCRYSLQGTGSRAFIRMCAVYAGEFLLLSKEGGKGCGLSIKIFQLMSDNTPNVV